MNMIKTAAISLIILTSSLQAGKLDNILEDISPDVKKWATVITVKGEKTKPDFEWFHYQNSAEAVDFWPASTVDSKR